MKITLSCNPQHSYPWFVMHGTADEEKRLEKSFRPPNSELGALDGGAWTSGRIILESPDNARYIAVQALRQAQGDGVWFSSPCIVNPVLGRPGIYDGFPDPEKVIRDQHNLDVCRQIVAEILLKDGFISEQQSREFSAVLPQPLLQEITEARGKVWLALQGSDLAIAQLVTAFSPDNGNPGAVRTSPWRETAGLVILEAQPGYRYAKGETAIATTAKSFRSGEVIIRRPYFIRPISCDYGHFTYGLQLREVKEARLETLCRQNVAAILARKGFVTSEEAQLIAEPTAKPQAGIALENTKPQQPNRLDTPARS